MNKKLLGLLALIILGSMFLCSDSNAATVNFRSDELASQLVYNTKTYYLFVTPSGYDHQRMYWDFLLNMPLYQNFAPWDVQIEIGWSWNEFDWPIRTITLPGNSSGPLFTSLRSSFLESLLREYLQASLYIKLLTPIGEHVVKAGATSQTPSYLTGTTTPEPATVLSFLFGALGIAAKRRFGLSKKA